MVEYHPISTRDKSRLYQFGKKVLLGIFLGYQLIAGGIWKGDIVIADLEDLEKLDASEIYHRRREVLISQKGDEIISPVADGTTKLSDRDYDFRETTLRREQTERSADFCSELQGERKRQNQQMRLKPRRTSGRFKVTSSIVITMNFEFNSMCRRKKHSLFH